MRAQPVGSEASSPIGVAIVAYRCASLIGECLGSLFASNGVRLKVVVVDNASGDGTADAVRAWAQGAGVTFTDAAVGELACAKADLTLLRTPVNGGFAYGCNRALEVLRADPAIDLFWLLNPDCQVLPDTAARFAAAGADGPFALMGGRTMFLGRPEVVQTDGGRVSTTTGAVHSANAGCDAARVEMPEAGAIDFISGASCVASRAFLDRAGLMPEDYFVFYEEVDWAMRRGDLPLRQVPNAITLHHGGTAIGSALHGGRASPFASYFTYRNRMRFMRRYAPGNLPIARAYALAKAAQLVLQGAPAEARAVFAGTLGLAPPRRVRERLDPAACVLAFGE